MSTNKSKDGVEVVTFQRRRGKKGFGQVIKIQKKEEESADKDPQEFDFRKARHDVFKFGVSGLDTNSKLDAKVALAVKLGARPPKNKYVNYKVLMAERKKEKEKEVLDRNEGRDRFTLPSTSSSKKVQKRKKKKDINDVRGLDYQKMGKFKSGVQVVTQQELKRK